MALQDAIRRQLERSRCARRMQLRRLRERRRMAHVTPTVDDMKRTSLRRLLALLEHDRPLEWPGRVRRIALGETRYPVMAGAQRRDPLRLREHGAQFAAGCAPLDAPHLLRKPDILGRAPLAGQM